MVDGGGVRGRDDGIARITTIRVGATIKAFHLFTAEYHRAGGMTTGIIVGEDSNGTTSEYLSNKFNGTGRAGKRISIGRSKIPGVFRV
jgi:hypothetical protein